MRKRLTSFPLLIPNTNLVRTIYKKKKTRSRPRLFIFVQRLRVNRVFEISFTCAHIYIFDYLLQEDETKNAVNPALRRKRL